MRVLFLESLPYRSDFRVGSHQYADRFVAAGWDVMWVSHPLSPLHLLHPVKRDMEIRKRGWRDGPLTESGVTYYSPFTLLPTADRPLLRSSWVAEHSVAATMPSLRGVVEGAGFGSPDVLWLTNPVFQPLAESLDPSVSVVRVADATAAFAQVPDSIRALDDRALRSAEIVFAVSQGEHDRIAAERSGVVRLPNGADYAHFAEMRDEPADLASIPHPRAIYVGAIEYWFDAKLVEDAARARPDTNFVIIGPARRDLSALESMENVHLLGARPYRDVPAYMQHCDVAIVPFARDEMVDSVHPIKVYEYLAASLPVVATPWTELEAMGAPISLAEGTEFVRAIEQALSDEGPTLEERLRYARGNSWNARFETALETLRPALTEAMLSE